MRVSVPAAVKEKRRGGRGKTRRVRWRGAYHHTDSNVALCDEAHRDERERTSARHDDGAEDRRLHQPNTQHVSTLCAVVSLPGQYGACFSFVLWVGWWAPVCRGSSQQPAFVSGLKEKSSGTGAAAKTARGNAGSASRRWQR
jgi:hypothetical protein